MPTYEYECKSCGYNFDAFQNMTDEPLKTCPKCNKEIRRLINGGTGVIFKGGGFYVTDKSKSSGKSGGKSHDSSQSTETKTAGTEGSSCPSCANAETCPKAVNS